MKFRHLAIPLVAVLMLWLTACSREASTTTAAPVPAGPVTPAQAYDAVAAQGKGFNTGVLMGANPVYVLFDPQCPHCSHLWNASLPLHGKARFVWIPVAIMNGKSLPQGAALLQASSPVDTMSAHEQSILAGQGGMSASASVPDEVEAAIEGNTRLLDQLGAGSVPFIVARNARSGQVVTNNGALATQALADFLGLDLP